MSSGVAPGFSYTIRGGLAHPAERIRNSPHAVRFMGDPSCGNDGFTTLGFAMLVGGRSVGAAGGRSQVFWCTLTGAFFKRRRSPARSLRPFALGAGLGAAGMGRETCARRPPAARGIETAGSMYYCHMPGKTGC